MGGFRGNVQQSVTARRGTARCGVTVSSAGTYLFGEQPSHRRPLECHSNVPTSRWYSRR